MMKVLAVISFILISSVAIVPAVSAGFLDNAMDRVIDSVDPNTDQNSREIAKEAAKSMMSPTQKGTDEHWDKMMRHLDEGFSTDSYGNEGAVKAIKIIFARNAAVNLKKRLRSSINQKKFSII
jgi:hypothetical protein